MATVSGTFIFALPEDIDSDQLLVKSSATKTGSYSTVATVSYEYGVTTHEYDSLDTTLWYKIQFNNSSDSEAGPDSDPVYGGDFNQSSPFLAVSTGTDGAQYATVQEVYDYTDLTTAEVTTGRVKQALRRARAVVDLKTAEMDLDRFLRTFETDVARRKYNATLRIIKEAEINIALGNIYRGLSDDLVSKRLREALEGEQGAGTISVGDTTLSGSGGLDDTSHMRELAALGNRYLTVGAAMLAAIQPTSVRLHVESDFTFSPRFRYPFNGY